MATVRAACVNIYNFQEKQQCQKCRSSIDRQIDGRWQGAQAKKEGKMKTTRRPVRLNYEAAKGVCERWLAVPELNCWATLQPTREVLHPVGRLTHTHSAQGTSSSNSNGHSRADTNSPIDLSIWRPALPPAVTLSWPQRTWTAEAADDCFCLKSGAALPMLPTHLLHRSLALPAPLSFLLFLLQPSLLNTRQIKKKRLCIGGKKNSAHLAQNTTSQNQDSKVEACSAVCNKHTHTNSALNCSLLNTKTQPF